jgi:putative restriction endonuclease
MNYWWVNHKQTYQIEIAEGYIWSPKRNNDSSRNQSYENLRLVNIGDIVFSYANALISAVGVVTNQAISYPKPINFGQIGDQWGDEGWLVAITWKVVTHPISPKAYISIIKPLLPSKYSPIKPDGNGNQGIYLASISERLGRLLIDMVNIDDIGANSIIHDLQNSLAEEKIATDIDNGSLPPTKRIQLIEARVGQGFFRKAVENIETQCRVTKLSNKSFLNASHIKPWRDSTDDEKLDGHNGFLLSPHVDRLFDKGYISFDSNGKMLYANHKQVYLVLKTWSLDTNLNVGSFTAKQKVFLEYHRDEIHKKKIEELKY